MASLFFYAGFGVTALAVLLGVNVLTYISGYLIGENDGPRSGIFRRNVLIISLVLIFMSLGLFKWSAFGLLLPVGMSFYIFTAAGYLIDVYKGKSKPERDPVTLSLFLCFFPNISSGPIERS
ncbi:MAG: hypothetical protein K6E33_07860, partial [Lachnospiraceae bacterium]|nr:hypothetical protein [Lachnospiraceae bacterium]